MYTLKVSRTGGQLVGSAAYGQDTYIGAGLDHVRAQYPRGGNVLFVNLYAAICTTWVN